MSLVKNSFSWSIGIPLCLKHVMVSHMHASHLRVWQTQLSDIASSCFDNDKTIYQTNMALVLREHCVTPARVESYIYIYMSVAVKIMNVKSRPMSQSQVKENARTITIQVWHYQLSLLQRTHFNVNFWWTDVNLYQSHWSVKTRSRSAGPTIYSKNMQKTVTMQYLITAIIAAEKFTLI